MKAAVAEEGANISRAVCGVNDVNGAVDKSIKKRRGRKKGQISDEIPAEMSVIKLGGIAHLTKKQRQSKTLESINENTRQHVDVDYSSAANDVVVQKVEKKRRRSRKSVDNPVFDQNSDDLQELDITVDERGEVHVHFWEQQEQNGNFFTSFAKKRVKSKKVKTEIVDGGDDGDTFNRSDYSSSSPAKKRSDTFSGSVLSTSLPAKKRGRPKNNTPSVTFEHSENGNDVRERCDSEVMTPTHLPSPQTRKRGRPKKSTNTSCEIVSSDAQHEPSPSQASPKKRGRPKKVKISDCGDGDVQANIINQSNAAERRKSTGVTMADSSVHKENLIDEMLKDNVQREVIHVSSGKPHAVIVQPVNRERRMSSCTSSRRDPACLGQSSQLGEEYDDLPAANCDDIEPIVIMPQTDDFEEHVGETTVRSRQRNLHRPVGYSTEVKRRVQ